MVLVILCAFYGPTAAGAPTEASAKQLRRALLCIHSHEGAWTASTGNGYYGGLQMDTSFEKHYGREFYQAWGHANRWPAAVQITVAMRAYLAGRGFSPWPTTARLCGLA
ncbi:MAG: transglycosylase family protein [Sulfuricaulis sp.]